MAVHSSSNLGELEQFWQEEESFFFFKWIDSKVKQSVKNFKYENFLHTVCLKNHFKSPGIWFKERLVVQLQFFPVNIKSTQCINL